MVPVADNTATRVTMLMVPVLKLRAPSRASRQNSRVLSPKRSANLKIADTYRKQV